MKKNIFVGVAVIAIAAVAAWNMNISSKPNGMSNVKLANIEALAEETTIVTVPCYSEQNKTCSFLVVDKDGNDYIGKMPDHRNA